MSITWDFTLRPAIPQQTASIENAARCAPADEVCVRGPCLIHEESSDFSQSPRRRGGRFPRTNAMKIENLDPSAVGAIRVFAEIVTRESVGRDKMFQA